MNMPAAWGRGSTSFCSRSSLPRRGWSSPRSLPGDSLLFAVGAVAATPGSPVHLGLTAVLLVTAAVLGDAVNYSIGYVVGPRIFSGEKSRILNKKYLRAGPRIL